MTSTASRSESDEDRWFFGKISGQEAEDHLKNAGGQDGTFLVRESSSSPGHFALTFMFHGEKTDVLIRSYWEDAFYSLKNIKVVSELLKSGYRKIDAKNNCGQTALHIACTKGNLELVRLLLEANANVDVRDQDGMTPLQHACRHNYPSIVHLLITEGKANLQLRIPVTGEVALHEAASCGSLECVKLLLSFHAPAWPRCSKKNTPAMLAKANQNLECYSLIVNHRPTIPLVRLPEYYHGRLTRDEAQRILKDQEGDGGQFLLRKSSSNESVFVLSMKEMGQVYHFQIDRKLAMYTIDNGPYFKCLETLVDHYLRFFDGLPCRLTTPVPPLEPLDESEFRAIYFEDEKFARSGSELELLVPSDDTEDDSYKDNFCLFSFDGHISQRLVSKSSSENLLLPTNTVSMDALSISPSASLFPSSPPSVAETVSTLQGCQAPFSSPSTPHSLLYRTIKGNKTEEIFGSIDSSSLSAGETLGVGEFGTVLKGIWVSPSGDQIDVAVKTLHDNGSLTRENFLREAKVMIDLNHPYIVKLLGVCQGPPVAMVQELAVMGSLLNFLLDFPEQIQVDFHFKLWAAQVADGMNYLEKKHFVHRDLAARNLLLSSITLVKISDFGLSRALGANGDYYKATEGGRWPLKWYAPESIYYGQFTHLSDVWSYGVTLWEMYTFGDQPYGELTGHEVADLLEKGERLPQPKVCPDGTFNLMLRCWDAKPKSRPTFQELVVIFRGSKDYVNIKPYFRDTR